MSRKKKPLPILENVTITDVAAEGKSLARVDEKVVFVPFAVPGDVVDLQVTKKRNKYSEARAIRFIKYSDIREVPKCEHFGVCGGCKWQNLPYAEQLKMKQKQVFDQLTRIGKVELPEFHTILGSSKQTEYRNKLEFGFSNKRWLTREQIEGGELFDNMNAVGFHITGAFDKIYPIKKCWLMDDLHNDIRNDIFSYALEHELTFFDLREQNGLLRNLMIRNSNIGEWMVLLQFGPKEGKVSTNGQTNPINNNDYGDFTSPSEGHGEAYDLLNHIAEKFPQITSLLWVFNSKGNDTFGDLPVHVFKGKDHIFEVMENLRFKVGPKSFYQTNTEQAYHLYRVARDFAHLEGDELVYDLYTGTGTIANFVANKARKVIGIEYVPEAIEDAKTNSKINGIDNTLFYAGDMKDILNEEFIEEHGRPDVIITDPPRAGMHKDVIDTILRACPKRIVYVSCNPSTQARDLGLLDAAYKVVAVQPVDMFPHTPHVENVVLLESRKYQNNQ